MPERAVTSVVRPVRPDAVHLMQCRLMQCSAALAAGDLLYVGGHGVLFARTGMLAADVTVRTHRQWRAESHNKWWNHQVIRALTGD
jgi:hypothetical protein